MLGLEKGKVKVVLYDKKWPNYFQKEQERVTAILKKQKLQTSIAHVGSTSVEGLKAKPIIDVVVGFKTRDDMVNGFKTMLKEDFDYIPAASTTDMYFMAKDDPRTFHYQLVVTGSPAWMRLIVFRDYLRRNKELAKEYEGLKVELAEIYSEDRLNYTAAKRDFMNAVMMRALNDWTRRRYSNAFNRVRGKASNAYMPDVQSGIIPL